MSTLAGRALDWWQARDIRERRMLAAMVLALAAFIAWYGVTVPLRSWRDDARARHDRAASELLATQTAASEIEALGQARPAPGDMQQLETAVLDAARAAGVAISRHRADGPAALQVDIESVATPALLSWLDALRIEHGIAPDTLEITEASGALRVGARFVLVEPGA